MSNNQSHGKRIEDWLKSCYPGASDHGRKPDSVWDIEAAFDKQLHLPTSVKSQKSSSKHSLPSHIELADARRFFSINRSFRMLLASYVQHGFLKTVYDIREWIIDADGVKTLHGDLTFPLVQEFHNSLLLFKRGSHEQAREFAQDHKQRLTDQYPSRVLLNPKIDSKTQRRLQCSVRLSSLDAIVSPTIYVENDTYRDTIVLPYRIQSTEREF